QQYSAFNRSIPADFSTACFPLCAAAITNSKITLEGLDFSDTQGDKIIFDHLEKMGMNIQKNGDKTTVDASNTELQGIEIDLNATPDALPILAVVGCFAKGTTYLKNVKNARIKECDRISAMTKELRQMGAIIEELEDGMIIKQSSLNANNLHGYDDHRIIMSLAIAGLNCDGVTTVDTAENVKITYPDFVEDLQQISGKIKWLS
ncbi:3-phosphoshikimate 1-carboxyvinyltransferase, partial [bacterium B13(2017)]